MSMFTLLKLAEALKMVMGALYFEAVYKCAECSHEQSRKYFAQRIDEIFGETNSKTHELIESHREYKMKFERRF